MESLLAGKDYFLNCLPFLMGVEFEMYALPSFSSCWDEDVLKFLYWLILAFDLKFEMSFM